MDSERKDPIEESRAELDAAQSKDDEERLAALERMHASLESEVEQTDPAGH